MNLTSVILKSLRHYWQVHLATLLAVAVTTTVLTGALTVGDSMRGSLRDLTLRRLGPIDHVVLASTFLDRDTADRWMTSPEFAQAFQHGYPALHFPTGTLELTNRNVANAAAVANAAVAPQTDSVVDAPGTAPEFAFDWTSVAVWAVDTGFDRLDWGPGDWPLPGDNEVVLNATAARRLGLDESQLGTLVTLRIGKPSDVPTESFIATKDDAVSSLPRLKWVGMAPDDGVGRLALSPGTETPANVFLSLTTAQRLVPAATRTARGDQPLINALLVTAPTWEPVSADAATAALRGLRPSIADAGLKVVAVDRAPLNYYSVSSVRMLLDDGQQRVLTAALLGLNYQPVLTYLANDLQLANREAKGVPFSMVSALDLTADSGLPLVDGSTVQQLQADEVLLNRWAAEDLGVEVGQSLRLRYYEPETVDGIEVEREALFRVAGIVELTTPDQPYQTQGRRTVIASFKQPPTAANDPWLTPEVPGVTDAVSIEAWDLPFETASKIRPQDDDYWQFHRTTPKAFITLGTGQRLWSSRFGDLTSYRVPADQLTSEELRQRLERAITANLIDAGFQILPVKRQGLGGSQGSTPFDVLFLMFSMFVVVSALLLLVLFVRLGLQQRAAELGLWLAVGFAPRQVARCWWAESLLAALGGLGLGSVAGVAYAGLMAWLMRTAWVGAVASPFLYLHWTWRSILLGGCGSFLVCALVVAWSVRRAAQGSARTLLSGRWGDGDGARPAQRWWFQPLPRRLLLLGAIGLSIGGLFATGDAQAVAFLGGGMGALLAMLATIYAGLIQPPPTVRLAWADVGRLNLARQPLRSLMIVGLVGIATFLILAVSAFRLSPTERGTAGFSYVVRTDTGVIDDLNAPAVRQRLLEQNRVADAAATPVAAAATTFFGFRFHDGEHASCNNPFQAGQPQVLGVQPGFVERFDDPKNPAFAWVAHTGQTAAEQQNPWRLLQRSKHQTAAAGPSATESGAAEPRALPADDRPDDDRQAGDTSLAAERAGADRGGAIPVIIDKNTAWYSLKVYLPGTRFTIDYPGVGPVDFELVGLLDNSLLQGVLLVAEDDFLRLFPKNVGQRYFLVADEGGESVKELRELGQALKDSGWQIRPAAEVLAVYLAVQNTYLSAFQSLGSLGLLLGTIGLVVAQFRSILERRRELALLQALGFANPRIQSLVTRETLLLMGLGFGVGLAGAAVGVLPHWWSGAADLPLAWLLTVLAAIAAIGWVAARVVGNWAVQGNLLRLLRNQ
jgi:putative ABC transport system permease protein